MSPDRQLKREPKTVKLDKCEHEKEPNTGKRNGMVYFKTCADLIGMWSLKVSSVLQLIKSRVVLVNKHLKLQK